MMNMTIKINLSQYKPQEKWYTMQEAAKLLNFKNIGRTKLMRFLRDEKILTENNNPYHGYIDTECFRLIEKDIWNGHGRVVATPFVPLVSSKGITLIKKLFERKGGVGGKN
jgi:phage antirepressor YoqD-like protein